MPYVDLSAGFLARPSVINRSTDSFFDVFLGIDVSSVSTGPISPPPEKTLISFSSSLTFNGRGIDLDTSDDVSGVEPSPFYVDSFFDVFVNVNETSDWSLLLI